MQSISSILQGYQFRQVKRDRKFLLGELEKETGLPLWKILKRTAGMQTEKDLEYILSAMKTVRGKDGAHKFNTVLYVPHKTPE